MAVQTRPAWLSARFVLGILVLLFAILGMVGVIPFTPLWVFGLIAGLTLAVVVPL